MTFITFSKNAILDMYRRWILHQPFDNSGRGRATRMRQSYSRMQQMRHRPIPPETPEDHFYEVAEERLSGLSQRSGSFKRRVWRTGGFTYE